MADKSDSTISGVKGWLFFVCIYLRVILPAFSLLALFAYYPYLQGGVGSASKIAILDIVARVLIAVFSYVAGTALVRNTAGALMRAKMVLGGIVAYNVLASFLFLRSASEAGSYGIGAAIGSAIGSTLIPILCFLYLVTSKRVLATYNGADASGKAVNTSGDSDVDASPVGCGPRMSLLSGWQRLWIATVVLSFLGLTTWAFATLDEVRDACISELHLTVYKIAIPDQLAQLAGTSAHITFPSDATTEEIVDALERTYPALKGKTSEYVSNKKIYLSEDTDPDSYRFCPPRMLKPRSDAMAKYAELIQSYRTARWNEEFANKARVVVTGTLLIAIGLFLAGIVVGWIAHGFKQNS